MAFRRQNTVSIFDINSRAATLALGLILFAAINIAYPAAQAQTITVLHNFTGGADGANPSAGLTMDAAGNLYGTASYGGYTGGYCSSGCGTVFKLTHQGAGWTFTPLYAFKGDSGLNNDAANPAARVVFGPEGNLYGTTVTGGGGRCNSFGGYGCGTAFKLSPPTTVCKAVFCTWTDTVLYSAAHDNGEEPVGDVVFDSAVTCTARWLSAASMRAAMSSS